LQGARRTYTFPDGVPDSGSDAYFDLLGRHQMHLPKDRERLIRRKYQRMARDYIFCRDAFVCVYCGMDMLESVDTLLLITKDHVFPKSRGGTRQTGNLVTCCLPCNQLKGKKKSRTLAQAQRMVARLREDKAGWLKMLQSLHR
ncbi:MAG: HNH endonuclease, partial [Anaerolineales bacterium]|nr:HNH endonuclease [Anaerolineales bacterium]